jgi:hypothetical protein
MKSFLIRRQGYVIVVQSNVWSFKVTCYDVYCRIFIGLFSFDDDFHVEFIFPSLRLSINQMQGQEVVVVRVRWRIIVNGARESRIDSMSFFRTDSFPTNELFSIDLTERVGWYILFDSHNFQLDGKMMAAVRTSHNILQISCPEIWNSAR